MSCRSATLTFSFIRTSPSRKRGSSSNAEFMLSWSEPNDADSLIFVWAAPGLPALSARRARSWELKDACDERETSLAIRLSGPGTISASKS